LKGVSEVDLAKLGLPQRLCKLIVEKVDKLTKLLVDTNNTNNDISPLMTNVYVIPKINQQPINTTHISNNNNIPNTSSIITNYTEQDELKIEFLYLYYKNLDISTEYNFDEFDPQNLKIISTLFKNVLENPYDAK